MTHKDTPAVADRSAGHGDDHELDRLLKQASRRFSVAFEHFGVDDLGLDILQIADMNAYLDSLAAAGDKIELPFWAKVWPSAILLAYLARRLPPRIDGRPARALEIGAGVGVSGLAAAASGVRTTLSDIDEDALLFLRANVLKNNLSEAAEVARVDFAADRLGQRFDYILGAEVIYRDDMADPALDFLRAHLADHPAAEAILGKDYHEKTSVFLDKAAAYFHIREKVIGYKESSTGGGDAPERRLCRILRLTPREGALT